jgi:predicted dehydrogenase
MMKLKVGFAGVGSMGLSHLKAMHLAHAAQAEAVAIGSRNEARIRGALEIAPGAKVFADDLTLIRSDLDAVFVSTPNSLHTRLGLEALRCRRHLFLEKPVGITRDECRQVLDAARKSDRVVMVGHELRYSPYFQKFKALIDAGEIGHPRLVWTREFRGPFQKKSGDWIQDNRRSGGTLVDKNCHHFDLMNWWVGARPRRVSAFGGSTVNFVAAGGQVAERGVEGPESKVQRQDSEFRNPHSGIGIEAPVLDHASVSFEYENGVRGSLQLCLFAREFPDEELEMGIVGDRGELRTRIVAPRRRSGSHTDQPDKEMHLFSPALPSTGGGGEGGLEILQWRRGADQRNPTVHKVEAQRGEGWGGHPGFSEIHEAFLQAIHKHERPLTTVAECVDGTLLAIAAEESIRRGTTVEI